MEILHMCGVPGFVRHLQFTNANRSFQETKMILVNVSAYEGTVISKMLTAVNSLCHL